VNHAARQRLSIIIQTSHNHTNKSESKDSENHQQTELDALANLIAPPLFDSILGIAHVQSVEFLDDG
jgi:hypothetical protein